MIDIKPPEGENNYMLSPDIDTQWRKAKNELQSFINLMESTTEDNDVVRVEYRFIKEIYYLMDNAYPIKKDSNRDLHAINKTLKEILREMRKRK